MPWRESSVMEERLRFVVRRLEGEPMTALCREFGISRKTGQKILARCKEHGLEALGRPATATRAQSPTGCRCRWRAWCVALKREKPHWGARKLRELLARRFGAKSTHVPARSTIHAVLDRHGLVEHARARHPHATGTPLSEPRRGARTTCGAPTSRASSASATAEYYYPLTVTDQASRSLLLCEALELRRESPVFTAFSRLFQERGLPARHPH